MWLSDFRIFVPLMKRLAGKRIATDADVTQAVTSCLHSSDKDIFYDGIQALVRRGW